VAAVNSESHNSPQGPPTFVETEVSRLLIAGQKEEATAQLERLALLCRIRGFRLQAEVKRFRSIRPQRPLRTRRLPAALSRRAGAGRPRPASAVRKIVAAHTLAPLADAASRDALGRHMSGAPMRRWSLEIYADHTDRTRREESPRRFSCSADFAHSAARGPLQTAAAVQYRHGAGGRRCRGCRPTLRRFRGAGNCLGSSRMSLGVV
jgi:hypothetical protein